MKRDGWITCPDCEGIGVDCQKCGGVGSVRIEITTSPTSFGMRLPDLGSASDDPVAEHGPEDDE